MTSLSWRWRERCSLCRGDELEPCLDFPFTPIANEFARGPNDAQELLPLGLVMCSACRHVQSSILVNPERLFKDYVYATSTSPATIAHLRDQARTINAELGLTRDLEPDTRPGGKADSFIVEVGCNDGALLEEFAAIGFPRIHMLGIEPATKLAEAAARRGFSVLPKFFSVETARAVSRMMAPPKVLVANNVFAHVPDVREVLEASKILLEDTGVLVMEVAHAADVLSGAAWDTIYHEHTSHHSLTSLRFALEAVGLPVFKAETLPSQIGRGSLRVWAASRDVRVSSNRDVTNIRTIIEGERLMRMTEVDAWRDLERKISEQGRLTRRGLEKLKGKKIWGYGAPAKMTTLIYAYDLPGNAFQAITDDSSWKQGLLTPGWHIPVRTMADLMIEKPDVVVVFAWNFIGPITDKLRHMGYEGQILTPQSLGFLATDWK